MSADNGMAGSSVPRTGDGRSQPHEREPFEIFPIERVDVYDSVIRQLNALVRSLAPGDRLPSERELVERLEVSRVSVREALRALEGTGRIEIRRNAGSFVINPEGNGMALDLKAVAPMGIGFLQHLVDIRACIEDKVVSLFPWKSVDHLNRVQGVLDASDAEMEGEVQQPGSLDLRFEAALGNAIGNPLLKEVQRSVHQLWVESWTACGIAPGHRRQLHAEHVEIFAALRQGGIQGARELMARHVDRMVGESVSTGH